MTLDYFYGQAGELFSFYRIPKALFLESRFQNLSTDAKTLYGILLDRMSLSAKNGWLDEQGRVFIIFTIEDVKRALCCADNKATKLLRELEEFGLIERKRRGLGKPSLVYVKNFSAESSKPIFQNRDFHDSGGFKTTSQDPAKSRCNKTDENNTEMSEPYPFYSEEDDAMSKREQLEGYFSQSLEVDTLLRLCPDDEDTIYQIVDLLVDTCTTNRKTLRIAGDDKPAEVVRSRFMKLNADHIRTIRSEEITIDVRICAALAANRGSGEVYLAAIAPDMELTVITLDEAPGILPCFDEDDACLNLPDTSLLLCYNPAQVLKMGGKHYLTGPVILARTNMDGRVISLTIDEVYLFQKYLASHSITLMADDQKLPCICID